MKRVSIVLLLVVLASTNSLNAQDLNLVIAQEMFETAGVPKPVVKTIDLPGRVKLEYAEQGNPDGIPVIFLHGITDSWHSFESSFLHLPESIHAYAISQRGHGDSERPSKNYEPKDFAADVAAFIKHQKLGAAFVAGHSMGGLIAQQFALDYPELTRGIVIIDSDPTFKDNPGMPDFHREVLKMEGSIDRNYMIDFQKATLSKSIDPYYFDLLVNEGLKVPASVFKAALTGIVETDLSSKLKKINAPVLIFWGDQDAFCFRRGQDLMVKNIRNARLLVYEGTGHALHWEQPERFAYDLVSFVNETSKAK